MDQSKPSEPQREVLDFDLFNIQVMSHLMIKNGVVDDEIVDLLCKLKWEHATLIDKMRVLQENANIDTKTGLLRYRENYLETVIKTASRVMDGRDKWNYSVSYIRLDVDDFSQFNNKYGHDLGDEVLRELATQIRGAGRPTDYFIRFGGEEFDLLLPNTPLSGASSFLDKLFAKIHSIEIPYEKEKLKVTVSAGVTALAMSILELKKISAAEMVERYQELQKEVDHALYESKYHGKNRWSVFDENKMDQYRNWRRLYSESHGRN